MLREIGRGHTTEDSPVYDIRDKELLLTLTISAVMFLVTVVGMFLIADTWLAQLGVGLYSIPIVGLLVFGALITVGRYLGLYGIGEDKTPLAIIGSVLLAFAYSWFGGVILNRFAASIYLPAVMIAASLSSFVALIEGVYVYTTDKDLSHWKKYSGYLFTAGIILVAIGSFSSLFLVPAFAVILLGFIADLMYEIWMTSHKERSPYANGLALYVAFTGVFVHILKLVLIMMSRR